MQHCNAYSKWFATKCLTAGVTVESKVVLGTTLKTSDLVFGGESSKTGGKSSRGDFALKSKDVGSKASDVGSGHGSTRNGVGATVQPGGEDGDTRGVDVDKGAVVGERGNAVRAVSGTDSEGGNLRSRGVAGCISTVVTSGHSEEDAGSDSVGSGRVDSGGLGSSKRHAADSTVGTAAGLCVVGDVVDASNDTGVGTRT